MSEDLIAFLTARLDEDEAAARESHYEGQRWLTEEEGVSRWPDDEPVHTADRKADARHIARHDPARVLREVAAKRTLLRWFTDPASGKPLHMLIGLAPETLGRGDGVVLAGAWILREIAAVYSDHPDYQPEWKP